MINTEQIDQVIGGDVYGRAGEKVGSVGQIYLDDETGTPEWATVQTGLFGTNESFVPITEAQFSAGRLEVPFDKDLIKAAPRVDAEQGHLSQAEEAELYRHYGLTYTEQQSGSGLPSGQVPQATPESGSESESDGAMTRSEEQLRVGKESREVGRARLRKYVVTEDKNVTVPVTREEVRLEREPITEENRGAATSGPEISEGEHEVTLREEQVVVKKETVPVERVRLAKDTVTEKQEVSEQVRKEQIETEGLDERR